MPRKAKPFWWRDGWYTDAGGPPRTLLARGRDNFAEAEKALARHLEQLRDPVRPRSVTTVDELIELFLDTVQAEKSAETYTGYRNVLKKFWRRYGTKRLHEITPLLAIQFRNDLLRQKTAKGRPYQPRSINALFKSLRRVWNWARQNEIYQGENPFIALRPLPAAKRQRLLSEEEFQKLLDHAGHVSFRHVLIALRYTPARPGEVRKLRWEHIDWERKLWILPEHKTAHTSKRQLPRVIAMPDVVEEVVRQRQQQYGQRTPFVFLNSAQRPWGAVRLALRMKDVRRKAGIKPDSRGETLVLYTNRHTILTEAVRAGVTGPQLLLLGGWTSPAMAEHYVHLAENDVLGAGLKAAEAMLAKKKPDEEKKEEDNKDKK